MEKEKFFKKYNLLKKEIKNLGFICTGSVRSVYLKCGKRKCICHKDENARHGPYNIWTRKVKAKTITRTLSNEQSQICKEFIQNIRKLESIIEKMKELTVEYIENYTTII